MCCFSSDLAELVHAILVAMSGSAEIHMKSDGQTIAPMRTPSQAEECNNVLRNGKKARLHAGGQEVIISTNSLEIVEKAVGIRREDTLQEGIAEGAIRQ